MPFLGWRATSRVLAPGSRSPTARVLGAGRMMMTMMSFLRYGFEGVYGRRRLVREKGAIVIERGGILRRSGSKDRRDGKQSAQAQIHQPYLARFLLSSATRGNPDRQQSCPACLAR